MSCFYCGKGVSLVRKRIDPDFCCEDHRRKYRERTMRGLSLVLEADEILGVRRRRPFHVALPHRAAGVMAAQPAAAAQFSRAPRFPGVVARRGNATSLQRGGSIAASPGDVVRNRPAATTELETVPFAPHRALGSPRGLFAAPRILRTAGLMTFPMLAHARGAKDDSRFRIAVSWSGFAPRSPEAKRCPAEAATGRLAAAPHCNVKSPPPRQSGSLPNGLPHDWEPLHHWPSWRISVPPAGRALLAPTSLRSVEVPVFGKAGEAECRSPAWQAIAEVGKYKVASPRPDHTCVLRVMGLLPCSGPASRAETGHLQLVGPLWPQRELNRAVPVPAPAAGGLRSLMAAWPASVDEDFARGLEDWVGDTTTWSPDLAGVRTGGLALLATTMHMADYQMELLAKIESRSLTWVFRAGDLRNYHAMKLIVGQDAAALVHYTVENGAEGPLVETALPVAVAASRPFRLQLDVRGNEFTTYVEGQPVDFWSDHRLPAGGIGFLSEDGERARLYWVKVASRDAWLPPGATQDFGIQIGR